MGVLEPINPIAGHLGGGVVLMQLTEPSDDILKYQVQISFSLDGPYHMYSNSEFSGNCGYITNMPLGSPVYMQVRSVSRTSEVSEWIQVKAGSVDKQTITMRCIAPRGSSIPAGAIFCVPKPPARIIGFRAVEEVNFQ